MASLPHKAAVIIINFNGREYIEDCLSSLTRQTYRPYEVILVDNGSRDGSVELVRERFPQVKIIRNAENLGFSRANNIGIRYALKKRCDYFVFLNYDTVVEEDFLEELVGCVKRNPRVGICQSKIYIYSDDEPGRIINSVGNEVHFSGFGFCSGLGEVDDEQYQQDQEITFAGGSAMLVRREVLEEIGLFDEDFFLYVEDLDFCIRARMMGWRVYLAPRSRVHHKYIFQKGKYKYFHIERNRPAFILKNYEAKSLLVMLPAFLFMEAAVIGFALWDGWLGLKLKAYSEALQNLKKTLRKRQRVQTLRKVPDREILSSYTGELNCSALNSPFLHYVYNPFMSLYWRLAKVLLEVPHREVTIDSEDE